MKTMTKATKSELVALPLALSFDYSRLNSLGQPSTKPGRGEAGWTVVQCVDLEDARAVMRAYPEARMPAWSRLESKWSRLESK